MKKLFILFIIIISIFLLSNLYKSTKTYRFGFEQNNNTVSIERKSNKAKLTKVDTINSDYRVFGITKQSEGGNRMFNYISFSIMMAPIDIADKITNEDNCEARAVQEAKTHTIIVPTYAMHDKLKAFAKRSMEKKRFYLHIEADLVEINELLVDNEKLDLDGMSGHTTILFNNLIIKKLEEIRT